MTGPARIDEADPFGDDGRREKLRILCTIGGAPSLAECLFESGADPAAVVRAFARQCGVLPALAPFPGLLTDPSPRVDD